MRPAALVALLFYSGGAGAAGIGVVDAWQAAVRHDPTFAAAQAQWEAGRTHLAQARALWMPTLVAQGSAGRGDQQSQTSGAHFAAPGLGSSNGVEFQTGIQGGNARKWGFVAEQPLFDANRSAGFIEQKNAAAVADAQLLAAQQDLLLRTARAYFSVLEGRAQLDALRRLQAAAERARAAAQARYESGDLPATDMREAQASVDAVGVQVLDAQSALALGEADFGDLTGLDAMALRALPVDQPVELPAGETLEAWTERAMTGSPQLAVQRLALTSAGAQVDRYGALGSPTLSIVAQLGRESLRGSGDFGAADVSARQASIALQASLPLFTGGLHSAQRAEAQALQRKAGAELEAADQQVRQQARTAWLGLATAAARVRALQRLRASSGDRLGATRLGVEVGERTALELLNAEADFLRAGTDFLRAQADWLLAGLQLQAVAGALTEAGLQRIDRQLVDQAAQPR